ncbi:RNA polymerase sigma factor [Prosthecobacter sp.]|uniref:RNA polymerase sigma factor n=1 Tax=Prosthecobacter sp. TaxID=1965333 RepID=UPI001D84BA16|nr:RNA polymerase sigma factor [Prosthecobacter sp.]MCB1277619.1 RNA polymerase sigma factor [Prosthecobacter sp.]
MELALEFGIELPAHRPIARRVTDSPPSFEQIVDAHYQGLHRFALSMCRSEATAQDLVQNTFLQWARKGHTLRDLSKVKTWLYTTIYREWLSIARREKKHVQVEFEPEVHGAVQNDDDGDDPRVDSATLQQALDELDPNYRAPLVLFYLKELSYREIAESLGIPIGTVMSRLSRAKDHLRSILLRLEGSSSANIIPATFTP